jgi:hypothetical protein
VPTAELRLSTAARKAYETLARSDRRLFGRVDRALDRLIFYFRESSWRAQIFLGLRASAKREPAL